MALEDIISDGNRNRDKYKSKDWFRDQYIIKDRTLTNIAEECDVSDATIRYWRDKFSIYKGRKCPLCDHQSESLGQHFRHSDHGYPDIPPHKKEMLTGHVMGDAAYCRGSKTGSLIWNMTNLEYMRWLKDELGWVCNSINLYRTSDESAQLNFLEERNFPLDEEAYMLSSDPDDYKQVYQSYTVSHPWINKLDWLDDEGNKRFPETLRLTPLMVKVWYCDDGNLNWHETGRPVSKITATSQMNILESLANKFEDVVCRPKVSKGMLKFNVDETEELLQWMGEAPSGMEYKFCLESKERYDELKP